MANELFKLMGEISVNSENALKVIDEVLKAAQGLYNYINNNSGTIKVTTGTSTTVIDQVLQDVKNLYNHINNNAGRINAENSTALSNISAISTAATEMYNLVNTKTGTVNIDTTAASEKLAALQSTAQTVTGYLGAGSGTTGSTGTSGTVVGALGTGSSGAGPYNWSWWGSAISDTAAWGSKIFKYANTAVNALAAAGVYKGIGETIDFFQAGYEYNTFKETSVAKLKTLLQTTPEDAASFYDELEQFAIDSPLTMEGVMESAVKLLGIGVEREQILATLQMLGDISLGDASTMSRIAKAQTDVMANTALLAQEGRQYTEAGVPIWRLLEEYYATQEDHDYYGYSAGDLKAMNKKQSPIPYEDVLAALQMATGEGGMFYDAINVMMGTTEGQAEKMQDAYRRTAGSVAEAFVSVFTSDTIPAMNEILQQLDEWADENPEILNDLATAFNNLATFGLKTFITSLEELATAWGTHKDTINSMLVLLGGLIFPTHPAVGTAMIVAGGGMLYEDTKDTVAEEVVESNETGQFSFSSALLPDSVEEQIVAGKTYEDLSEEDREQYDKAAWWRTVMNFVDTTIDHFGVLDDFSETQVKYVDPAKYGLDLPIGGETDSNNQRIGTATFNLDKLTGGFSSNSLVTGILAGVQLALDALPGKVETASQAGVAAGFNGVTINGYVTTGDVKLDDGTIVGSLTPYIDLKLGQAASQTNWG